MRPWNLLSNWRDTGAAVIWSVCIVAVAGWCLFHSTASAQNLPAADKGMNLFKTSGCFVCHGEMGAGGAGPGLRGDPFLAISDYVVAQILLGRTIMPAYGEALNDEQIAAVASYIRNSWGNDFGNVEPQRVAQLRKRFEAMNVTALGPPPPDAATTATAR
jgi:mono/diheme cytochrome c family protein